MTSPGASVDFKTGLSEILDNLATEYPSPVPQRLRDCFDVLVGERRLMPKHPLQRPRVMYYPGLAEDPWIATDRFASTAHVAAVLKNNFSDIRAEFAAADKRLKSYNSTDLFKNLKPDDWSSIAIWKKGCLTEEAAHFPKTVATLAQFEQYLFPWRGEVTFLRLKAGAYLPPHHDWSNAQITCHFGINTPENCALRVAEEEKTWQAGEALFFDHSFLHSAYNRSNADRDILLINLIHPDLSPAEVAALQRLGSLMKRSAKDQERRLNPSGF